MHTGSCVGVGVVVVGGHQPSFGSAILQANLPRSKHAGLGVQVGLGLTLIAMEGPGGVIGVTDSDAILCMFSPSNCCAKRIVTGKERRSSPKKKSCEFFNFFGIRFRIFASSLYNNFIK